MKTKITLILVCMLTAMSWAQNGINYKAVVKDASGNIVANQNIGVQFTVLEDATASYVENHPVMTDDNGIAILNIGEGSATTGTFGAIDWNKTTTLKVEIDIDGGLDNLTNMGTTAFKSVPYAKSASTIELPYYDEGNEANAAAFHIQNDAANGRYGIAGSVGVNGENLPSNNAGVLGHGVDGHGVYGYAATSFWAGVQGVSNSPTGVGVQGYGFGGGVGGHFYTTSTGVAALTTGRGNVGIGISEPEHKLHMGGDLFVQTNLGELRMGFPDNGNQWQLSTRGSGADLQFQSKVSESNTFTTQFRMRQGGEFQFGNLTTGTPEAWVHIGKNSTLTKPHLKLEEVGTDYARLELTNTTAAGAYWHLAGLPSATTSSARLNFYFRNASGAADRMTITGDGEVGINGTPTARLHVHQRSQTVSTGLRFSDNTANADWDVTHGFALRFHYGGSLKGLINATTGAYVQSSDVRLKNTIENLPSVLNRVENLRPTTYVYNNDESNTQTIGLIAQEVQKIFPEVVYYSEADDVYGIDYGSFSVIAIKAIQEQQSKIESLEKRLISLENRVKE